MRREEAAIFHAQRCLAMCEANGIGDFDLAFAYEALARAYAAAGDSDRSQHFVQLGKTAGEVIKDEEDREYFFAELNTVPGRNG